VGDTKQTEQAARRMQQTKRRLGFLARAVGIGVIIVVIFEFGVGVGNGSITFNDDIKTEQTSLPNQLDYASVNEVYQILKRHYDGKLDPNKLLDGMKAGLVNAGGDPYTEYFDAKSAKDFNDQLSGSFSGIGAELGQDSAGNVIVISPIDGFPAQKAGLRAQDVIESIDGKSTAGMSVDEAVGHIRGTKGTKVTLKVLRNKTDEQSIAITRADIKLPSVKWQVLDGGVGYMQITQFGDDTTDLAIKAANDLKAQHVKGIVLDLRDNPGGLLDAAVNVSSLWLPQGSTVLQEKRGGKVTNTYPANGQNILQGIPTTVLINEGSASAAEITAGALRDNHVATLVGAKSFGKGSVQQVRELSGGAEMKVTIARWYRPNGQNIDKKGITPDKAVGLSADDMKAGKDPQKDAAITLLQQ